MYGKLVWCGYRTRKRLNASRIRDLQYRNLIPELTPPIILYSRICAHTGGRDRCAAWLIFAPQSPHITLTHSNQPDGYRRKSKCIYILHTYIYYEQLNLTERAISAFHLHSTRWWGHSPLYVYIWLWWVAITAVCCWCRVKCAEMMRRMWSIVYNPEMCVHCRCTIWICDY